MSSSRDVVLGRIRAALADEGPGVPVPRDYLRRGERAQGSEQALELLTDRLVTYKALVDRVDAAGLADAVESVLREMTAVVIGPGLDAQIAAACGGNRRRVIPDSDPTALTQQELHAVDAVVTTARVAIAMSGTIILDGRPGQGRRAITLVPGRHVIVLRSYQVAETVAEAIAMLEPTAPLTMIAGPSGDQRHRIAAGRGRARSAHAARHHRRVIHQSPRRHL